MTSHLPITLQDLQVLNEKATQGLLEATVTLDDECVIAEAEGEYRNLLAEVSDAREHWTVEQRMNLTRFIAALVNYYRSGALQRLAELAEDGKRYRWLKEQELKVGSLAVHCRVYDGYHFGVPGHKLDAAIDSARAPSIKEEK
jgi:hypothetical protein